MCTQNVGPGRSSVLDHASAGCWTLSRKLQLQNTPSSPPHRLFTQSLCPGRLHQRPELPLGRQRAQEVEDGRDVVGAPAQVLLRPLRAPTVLLVQQAREAGAVGPAPRQLLARRARAAGQRLLQLRAADPVLGQLLLERRATAPASDANGAMLECSER